MWFTWTPKTSTERWALSVWPFPLRCCSSLNRRVSPEVYARSLDPYDPKAVPDPPSMSFGATSECSRNGQSSTLLFAIHQSQTERERHRFRTRHSQNASAGVTGVDQTVVQLSPEGELCVHSHEPLPEAPSPKSRCSSSRAKTVNSIVRACAHEGCARAKYVDISHGVRCLSTKSASRIVGTTVYLTAAFRSQGFSPSQRLHPLVASWLCFAPLPSIGFRPPELFPPSKPLRLSTPSALVPFGIKEA